MISTAKVASRKTVAISAAAKRAKVWTLPITNDKMKTVVEDNDAQFESGRKRVKEAIHDG